jgi:predicted porin
MDLRRIALTTTALVAIATVASPAQAGQYMGKVNLGFGHAWEDYSCDGGECSLDLEYTTLHGSASVNVPYNERVNFQFDIFGNESLDEAFDCGDTCGSFYGGFGAGAHLNYNDPQVGAIGVFGALGRAAAADTTPEDFVVFAGGLEAQYFCNAWTVSAQAGFLDTDQSGYGLVKEAGFIRVGGIYYPAKNLKISAGIGYLDGDTTSTDDPDTVSEWNWSFGIEYLFGKTMPISTYVEYRGQSSEAYSPNTYEADRHEGRIGVRFAFGPGADDLQKQDRDGAAFESPDILTWSRFDSN